MVKIVNGEEWVMPATIDDPIILDEISNALADLKSGFPALLYGWTSLTAEGETAEQEDADEMNVDE